MKKKLVGLFLALGTLFAENTLNYSQCMNAKTSSIEDPKCSSVLFGTKNTRDLGGHPTGDGRTTQCGRFFRSDNAVKLPEEDIDKLKKLNLVLVIDLRNAHEIKEFADGFVVDKNVKRLNAPLFDFKNKDELIDKLKKNELSWGKVYNAAVADGKVKGEIKKIFDSIAESKPGLILFHCTHGKDRTGIVSALILGLCGVREDDIVSDYVVSQKLLNPDLKGSSTLPNIHSTNESNMEGFVDFIVKGCNGYEEFLLNCGISQDTLKKVKSRLLDD